MSLTERYQIFKGETYNIYVAEELTPRSGGVYILEFKIEGNGQDFSYTIKLSDSLYNTWLNDQQKRIYKILKVLGIAKIKRNLELLDFNEKEYLFTSINTPERSLDELAGRLNKETDKIRNRELLERDNFKMKNLKNFRIKVLQLHYKKSDANQYNSVLRPDIAKELGCNYNGETLMKTLRFLEDKEFLKCESNVEDSITTEGIEEVENKFPCLKSILAKSEKESQSIVFSQKIGKIENVGRDKIEQYGDKGSILINSSENKSKEKWYQKWWGQIIIGIIVLLITLLIKGKNYA